MKSKEQIKIPDHTGKRETRLLAFVWNCGFFSRDVSDEKIIEMWRKSPARSLDDSEDETFYDVECLTPDFYDVECLTPDELAERINDESFAHTEDYVRFINVSPDLLYPDRK